MTKVYRLNVHIDEDTGHQAREEDERRKTKGEGQILMQRVSHTKFQQTTILSRRRRQGKDRLLQRTAFEHHNRPKFTEMQKVKDQEIHT